MENSFFLALILPPLVLSSPLTSTNESVYTSVAAKDLQRTFEVRLAAVSCSCISMTASLVAFYWFCRMEKRFRHRLVMLLVYGDLIRGTWLFVFAVISLAQGTVETESSFCQSTGFLIQYGTETSDIAVLVIAIHSALQVFRLRPHTTSEGLYLYRYYVYAGAFLIPSLMSGLAFINPDWGYLSQGAYCSLPIRPFWYRLALAWIPRYLIAAIVVSLAIAIYAYVGFEFRSYPGVSQSIKTSYATATPPALHCGRNPEATASAPIMTEHPPRRASSIAHDIVASHRRALSVSFVCAGPILDHASLDPGRSTHSLPESSIPLPLKRSKTVRPFLFNIPSGYTVRPPDSIDDIHIVPSPSVIMNANRSLLIQDPEILDNLQSPPPPKSSPGQRHIARRRTRIHRQLRLMFIYPLVYTLMWLLPFIEHCMMYQDKYALRPLWFLRLGGTICIASMGFVDCLVFSLREKPWQSISTSDGTFWGSFAIWRASKPIGLKEALGGGHVTGGNPTMETTTTDSALVRGDRVRSSIRSNGGSNEYGRIAAEQAWLRLELEREERFAALRARIASQHASMDDGSVLDDGDGGSKYDDGEGGERDSALEEKDVKGKGRAVDRIGEQTRV